MSIGFPITALHFDIQIMMMMMMRTTMTMLTTEKDRLVSVCEFKFVCMCALCDAVWRVAHVTFQIAIADRNRQKRVENSQINKTKSSQNVTRN